MSLCGDLTWHNAEKKLTVGWAVRANIFTWQLKCNYQPRSHWCRWKWRRSHLSHSYKHTGSVELLQPRWGFHATQVCLSGDTKQFVEEVEGGLEKRRSLVNAVLQRCWNCTRALLVLGMQSVISRRQERAYKNTRNTTQSALLNNHWELRHCWLIALVKEKACSVLTVNWPLEARGPWRKPLNSFTY